jgi:hypothetical protein
MFDDMVGNVTDKVAGAVLGKLWTLVVSILGGLGWGSILIGVGLMLGFMLIARLICRSRLLLVLPPLLLLAGYCISKGVTLDAMIRYLTGR